MRRFAIHHLLPALFCAIPAVAAVLVYVAVPPAARADYLMRLKDSAIDWIILGVGSVLFVTQTVLAWRAMKWRDNDAKFDVRAEKWLEHTSTAAEWFPLLGLIGTVAAILQTFSSFGPGSRPAAEEIIQKYGPAITATGSGLFMALLNILPIWMVGTAQRLIRSLAGVDEDKDNDVGMVALRPASHLPGGGSRT